MNRFEHDHNLKTLHLSENANSNKEFSDDLFEKFYKENENRLNSPDNLNVKKLFIINNLKKDSTGPRNLPGFYF